MSIVRGIIQGFIGNLGIKIGDWYFANSLWINGTILLYALLISIAWKNYMKVSDFLLRSITDEISPKMKTWSKSEITKQMKNIEIPWEEARKKILIPLFAKSGSYVPKLVSTDLIKKTYTTEYFIETLREINKK